MTLARPVGIPRASGCYLFRDAHGTVIYVGKAVSLAQRLANYFQRREVLDVKTQALMDEAASVEWILTPNEVDALILENELIKQNQPRYNLVLKDDKSFPYVAIDLRTPYPVPSLTRSRHVRGVRYFGPFADVGSVRRVLDELAQAFPLRTCTRHKFQYHERLGRPCLLYDIGRCPGPCAGLITPDEYAEQVEAWSSFFEGRVAPLRTRLTSQMDQASAALDFEAAARARDSLAALERAAQHQSVVLDDHSDLDVVAVATDGGRAAVVRFRVRGGRVVGRGVTLVEGAAPESGGEVIEAALSHLYGEGEEVPPEVVVSEETSALAAQFLAEQRGRAVRVRTVQRGRRQRALEMARSDARSVLQRDMVRREHDHLTRSAALEGLGRALRLAAPPYRIECFDMSHLQGTNYVGSMVVFEDGLPAKSAYRRFHVREVAGNDDVGAMAEVLRRRLARAVAGDPRFAPANLVILDGGLGQLHAVEAVVAEMGLTGIELAALAKREELLFRPGTSAPVVLPRGSEELYLVQRVRDEAHRFAITFHRSTRGRAMVASALDGVPGLGPARREGLLAHFGSLDRVRAATREELEGVPGLPQRVGRSLYDHVHGLSGARGRDDE